jgi:hypothetical protein
MPIGPSSRPQEPLHVFAMALALTLAAFTGGALGVLWHWAAGEDVPDDQIAAVSEPVKEEAPAAPPDPPRPSPGAPPAE